MSDQTININMAMSSEGSIADIRQFIAVKGDPGESAYAYAVRVNGYTGTEAEYYNQFIKVFYGDPNNPPAGMTEGQLLIKLI